MPVTTLRGAHSEQVVNSRAFFDDPGGCWFDATDEFLPGEESQDIKTNCQLVLRALKRVHILDLVPSAKERLANNRWAAADRLTVFHTHEQNYSLRSKC
jgi:hypothetical protein